MTATFFRRSYGAAHRPGRVKNRKSARTRTDRYERTSLRSMIYSDAFPREESALVTMAYFKKVKRPFLKENGAPAKTSDIVTLWRKYYRIAEGTRNNRTRTLRLFHAGFLRCVRTAVLTPVETTSQTNGWRDEGFPPYRRLRRESYTIVISSVSREIPGGRNKNNRTRLPQILACRGSLPYPRKLCAPRLLTAEKSPAVETARYVSAPAKCPRWLTAVLIILYL